MHHLFCLSLCLVFEVSTIPQLQKWIQDRPNTINTIDTTIITTNNDEKSSQRYHQNTATVTTLITNEQEPTFSPHQCRFHHRPLHLNLFSIYTRWYTLLHTKDNKLLIVTVATTQSSICNSVKALSSNFCNQKGSSGKFKNPSFSNCQCISLDK